METTVVNLNDYVAPQFGGSCLVVIDRTTKWGNPFRVGKDGGRADVIEKYRQWLWRKIRQEEVNLYELADLHGCELGCHCHPVPRRRPRARRRVGRQVSRRDAERSGAQRAWLRSSRIQPSPRLRTTKGVNDERHRDT